MIKEFASRYLLIPAGRTYSGRQYFKAKTFQRFLEKQQYKPPDELESYQNNALREMIRHAYTHVPYYRETFKREGITPDDIKGKADLKALPFLTKGILNRNLEHLVSEKGDKNSLRLISTGGTTGTPINFYRDWGSEWKVDGNNWRFWKFCGYRIGSRLAKLWGNENDLLRSINLYGRLKSIMDNDIVLNFYDLSEQRLRRYVQIIQREKPRYWKGFSSAVYTFVRYLSKNRIDVPLPQAVIITSDKIEDVQRKELDDFFNKAVFDEYGCREFSIMGFECEAHEGIHMGMENIVVEVIPTSDLPGYGEVVVTSLTNWGMPFIRYRLGDYSRFLEGNCSCGRSLPRLESIGGRLADFVVTKSEKLIYGDFFAHLLYGTKGVEHYRVTQEEVGKVLLCLERNEFFDEQETACIAQRLKEMTQGDLELEIAFADKIDMHGSGKRRSVVSKISKDYLP